MNNSVGVTSLGKGNFIIAQFKLYFTVKDQLCPVKLIHVICTLALVYRFDGKSEFSKDTHSIGEIIHTGSISVQGEDLNQWTGVDQGFL